MSSIIRKRVALIGLWGQTGVGKTTFISSVIGDGDYGKLLFIDADRGSATIDHLIRPELVIHRKPAKTCEGGALAVWLSNEIANAHKHEGVGAIVIEGLARVNESMVAANILALDPEKMLGNHLRRCYIAPSQIIGAIVEAIANLQARLQAADRECVVCVTCNTKNKTDDESGDTWQIPALSDNLTGRLQGRCDAFVELRRLGSNVMIHTDRDKNGRVPWRKLRHAKAANAIARAKSLNLASMIELWGAKILEDSKAVETVLAQSAAN